MFVRRGYGATSVADILESADVSRGAMYHHFSSKQDVFAAVFVQTSTTAIRRSAAQVPADATPLQALVAACLAWLTVATEPSVAQILFVDGPVALGWERCRSLEEAASLGVMRAGIAAAVDSGEIDVSSIDLVARLLNALLAEAALSLQSTTSPSCREEAAEAITAMIGGLATQPTRPSEQRHRVQR